MWDFCLGHDIRTDQERLKRSLKAPTLPCGGQCGLPTSLRSSRREDGSHSRMRGTAGMSPMLIPNPNTASPDPRVRVLGSRRVRGYRKCFGQRNSLGKEVSSIPGLLVGGQETGEGSQILRHPRTAYLLLASRTKYINTSMCCICRWAHTRAQEGFVT